MAIKGCASLAGIFRETGGSGDHTHFKLRRNGCNTPTRTGPCAHGPPRFHMAFLSPKRPGSSGFGKIIGNQPPNHSSQWSLHTSCLGALLKAPTGRVRAVEPRGLARALLPVRVAGGVTAGFVAFRAAPRRLRFLDGRGCSGWWALPFFELWAHRMRAVEVRGFSLSLLPIHVALGVTTGALAIRARTRRWRLLFLLRWWHHGLRGRIEVHDVIDAASAVAAHATFGPWWRRRGCNSKRSWHSKRGRVSEPPSEIDEFFSDPGRGVSNNKRVISILQKHLDVRRRLQAQT